VADEVIIATKPCDGLRGKTGSASAKAGYKPAPTVVIAS
jgi:hypothetical protein